jgi:hypothetical protein
MMKKFLLFLLLILSSANLCASIAVLPYRDHAFDSRISGSEYAKLLSLGILLLKDTDVLSPAEADIGMKQLGINPDGAIDEEDLHSFGIKYNVRYILLGTISKNKGDFVFDNVFYSVKDRKVLSRNNNRARDIYRLVQLEIKDTLIGFSKKKAVTGKTRADILFLFDNTYSMSDEWNDVRQGILSFSAAMISKLGVDTRIYIAPFSDRKSFESVSFHHNTIKELNEKLSRINPGGGFSLDKFTTLLKYSIKNIKWRSDASKDIYIISNSKLSGMFFPQKIAMEAKERGVRINVISAGKISGEYNDVERLATLTGGMNFSISYHQKAYDKSGNKHELYLQRGRIFHSIASYHEWRKGILSSDYKNPRYVKTPESLDEVFHTKTGLTPDKLIQTFSEYTGIVIMQMDTLQNNTADILSSMQSSLSKSSGTSYSGRALITDGKVSFWVKVKDLKIMDTFSKHAANGFYLKAGFTVKKSDSDAYGIELIPVTVSITSDYIPELAKTTFSVIVKNQEFFMTKGLGSPPVWFVDVKIENIDRHDLKPDIRD